MQRKASHGYTCLVMAVRTIDFLTYGFDPDRLVQVDVVDGLTVEDLSQIDAEWETPMSELVAEMTSAGFSSDELPPSWGWCIRQLFEDELTSTSTIIGIEHENEWEGVMLVYTDPRPCYHQRDADGIYLAYIAAAPRNLGYYLSLIDKMPTFDDVGEVLLSVLVRKSVECGCRGRVILHSAKGSEEFYRKCGITELGIDGLHPSELIRFEITEERAKNFLGVEQ